MKRVDCPECRGNRTVTLRHVTGDPQLEVDITCGRCFGLGYIDVEDEEEEDNDPDDNE